MIECCVKEVYWRDKELDGIKKLKRTGIAWGNKQS